MRQRAHFRQLSSAIINKGANSQHYRESMIRELSKHIQFDGYCCTLIDPIHRLSIGSVTESSVQQIHHKLFSYEYGQNNGISYEDMLAEDRITCILSAETNGELIRSKRYCEVLEPAGFSDEARVLLMSDGQCWGFLTLFKKSTAQQPYFQGTDEQLLAIIAPILGAALKQYHHYITEDIQLPRQASAGLVIVSQQLELLAVNKRGEGLLELLRQQEYIVEQPTGIEQQLPKPLQALALKSLLGTVDDSCTLLVPIPQIGYITLSSSILLGTTDQTQLAITIDAASAHDMLSFLMNAYRLTPREQDIVRGLIKGSSSKEIAAEHNISAYTVQDHLKSIYGKLSVSSRQEVLWKLFSKFQLDADM